MSKTKTALFGLALVFIPSGQMHEEIFVPTPKKDVVLEEIVKTKGLCNINSQTSPDYSQWIMQAIAFSKKNNYSIVIDKSQYSLFLFENGKIHSEYPVELGFNPISDKAVEGDGCTPEGLFRVSWKKGEGKSRYHKAFLLDYPNARHKEIFRQLQENGRIKPYNTIGGDIEIHGHGSGKPGNNGGRNWTAGCIALENSDMDKIFPYVNTGTLIAIVGYRDNN